MTVLSGYWVDGWETHTHIPSRVTDSLLSDGEEVVEGRMDGVLMYVCIEC